ILDRHARIAEQMGQAIGERLDLGIGQSRVAVLDRDPIAPPLLDPRVEEVVRHVESLGKHYRPSSWRAAVSRLMSVVPAPSSSSFASRASFSIWYSSM